MIDWLTGWLNGRMNGCLEWYVVLGGISPPVKAGHRRICVQNLCLLMAPPLNYNTENMRSVKPAMPANTNMSRSLDQTEECSEWVVWLSDSILRSRPVILDITTIRNYIVARLHQVRTKLVPTLLSCKHNAQGPIGEIKSSSWYVGITEILESALYNNN